jgi:predicted nucleic acid-binding protein
MTVFVLDNSVAMRWLLNTKKAADQQYALGVLDSLENGSAIVPNLWHLEATNVLLSAEKRDEISLGEIEGFISQLENLSIQTDTMTSHHAFNRTLTLARAYKLSSYDAAYLELAIREGLPLATLDKTLIKAAIKAGVEIHLKNSV